MAIRPETRYPGKINAGDANYPQGSARDVIVPGDGTGTPLKAGWLNDLWGLLQKMLVVGGISPSGNPDTILASDYMDALNLIYQRSLMYDDSGAADAYVLGATSGATVAAYFDGMICRFRTTNPNTGAATVDVDGIGVKNITAYGSALLANDIPAGRVISMIYNAGSGNFELLPESIDTVRAGTINFWPTAVAPTGWLECDGASLLRSAYPSLFLEIGVTYGNVDATHFTLPDLRGKFVRGFDNGAGVDPDAAGRTDRGDGTIGDNVGTNQADAFESHVHTTGDTLSGAGAAAVGPGAVAVINGRGAAGGPETRPVNIGLMGIIKI